MARFLKYLILGAIIVVLVPLAVANRHEVSLSFNPFDPQDPRLTVHDVPLFWVFFASVAVGVVIGGIAVWARQGRYRKEARVKRREADKWQKEADQLRGIHADNRPGSGIKGLTGPDTRSAA